jgi:hypothetical protein
MTFSRRSAIAAVAFLCTPVLTLATAITVNGSCQAGACNSVDVLPDGGYTEGSLDFIYSFQNGDQFQITSHYGALNSSIEGWTLNVNSTAVYLGNSGNNLSGHDVLSLSFLQNYSVTGDWDGTYSENTNASVVGPVGTGSVFQAQLLINNTSLGVMGPFGPGVTSASSEAYVAGLTSPIGGDFEFVYDFGEGSEPGATISSLALPEPNYALAIASVALLIGLSRFARFRGWRASSKTCSELNSN